jgi:AcrR family transcriptional regulator
MGKKQPDVDVAIGNSRGGVTQRGTDLRSERTRVFIQNALIDLIEQRGFDGVSVRDISRQAMVNRATFYRYYRDKYHLVEDIFKSAVARLAAEIGPPLVIQEASDLTTALKDKQKQAAWVGLFEHFASNSRMYLAMLSGKGSAWFQYRMREDLRSFLKGKVQGKQQKKDSLPIPVEVARCFFVNAIVGVAHQWLEEGMKYSASQMAQWFLSIAFRGYVGAIAGLTS